MTTTLTTTTLTTNQRLPRNEKARATPAARAFSRDLHADKIAGNEERSSSAPTVGRMRSILQRNEVPPTSPGFTRTRLLGTSPHRRENAKHSSEARSSSHLPRLHTDKIVGNQEQSSSRPGECEAFFRGTKFLPPPPASHGGRLRNTQDCWEPGTKYLRPLRPRTEKIVGNQEQSSSRPPPSGECEAFFRGTKFLPPR